MDHDAGAGAVRIGRPSAHVGAQPRRCEARTETRAGRGHANARDARRSGTFRAEPDSTRVRNAIRLVRRWLAAGAMTTMSPSAGQLRRSLSFRDLFLFYIATTFSLRWMATAA